MAVKQFFKKAIVPFVLSGLLVATLTVCVYLQRQLKVSQVSNAHFRIKIENIEKENENLKEKIQELRDKLTKEQFLLNQHKASRDIYLLSRDVSKRSSLSISNIIDSTVLLFAEDPNTLGAANPDQATDTRGPRFRCTASAIYNDGLRYLFVTAAHCVCEDHMTDKTTIPTDLHFFISPEKEWKSLIKATPVACGFQHEGDDFALLLVETARPFPVLRLGSNPKIGDNLVGLQAPAGFKQMFAGMVTAEAPTTKLEDSDEGIKWSDYFLVQIPGTNHGSSGAPIICSDQKKLCGLTIGAFSGNMVAVPVNRLKEFLINVADNSYPYQR